MPSERLSEIFGKNIVRQRKKIGLSQKELAAKLDITYESMSRIERGVAFPQMSRLQNIADSLECSIITLFQDNSTSAYEKTIVISEALESLSPKQQDAIIKAILSMIDAVKIKK